MDVRDRYLVGGFVNPIAVQTRGWEQRATHKMMGTVREGL